MTPDLISTAIAFALVCGAVLDRPLLNSHPWLVVAAGAALAALGIIANRVDYLKWPGLAVAAAGAALVVLIGSGLSSASPETGFWVVFWGGNVAGLMALWSALYRGPEVSQQPFEPG